MLIGYTRVSETRRVGVPGVPTRYLATRGHENRAHPTDIIEGYHRLAEHLESPVGWARPSVPTRCPIPRGHESRGQFVELECATKAYAWARKPCPPYLNCRF